MSNNQSIQILRGTRQAIYAHSSEPLLAGQPLYNMDDNYLTIGDGSKNIGDLPIIVREVHGYASDNSTIAETVGSAEWRFYASSATQANIAVSNMDLQISTSGSGKNLVMKSTGGDVNIQSNGTLTLQDTATGSNKLGKIVITPGDASASSVLLQNGAGSISIKDTEVEIKRNSSTVFISDSTSTNISSGDTEIVINHDTDSGSNRGVIEFFPNGATDNNASFIKMTTGGMTVGTDAFNSSKKITGLTTKATTAANLSTYENGASSGTKNVSVSFANAGTVTVKAGGVTSDSADVIAKKISINNTPNTVVVQHTVPSSPADNTIYLIY